MLAGVVQEDVDRRAAGVVTLQPSGQPQGCGGVDPLAPARRQFHRLQVQRPVRAQPPASRGGPDRGPVRTVNPAVGRTAPPFGMDRVSEHGRPVGRRVPHRPFVLPYEGLPRRPVGLPGQRLRLHVTESQPVHQLYRAAAGVLHAVQPLDDVPHPVGVARRAFPQLLPERRLPGPGQLALTLRIRRRIHRCQARPAEPAQPAAHRVGVEMEEPADLADAVSAVKCHERVRAPHLGAPAFRPRIIARSASRSPAVRMQPVPDMPFPVCSARFRGIWIAQRIMSTLKDKFMIPSIHRRIILGLSLMIQCPLWITFTGNGSRNGWPKKLSIVKW